MGAYEASHEYRSIIYRVDEGPLIAPRVLNQLESDGYQQKEEHHITLVSSDFGSTLSQDGFAAVADYFEALRPVKFEYFNALYEIEKPKVLDGRAMARRSLVTLVFSHPILRQIKDTWVYTDIHVPQPLLHMTIATKPDTEIARRGIGIASQEEWVDLEPILYETDWLTARRQKRTRAVSLLTRLIGRNETAG